MKNMMYRRKAQLEQLIDWLNGRNDLLNGVILFSYPNTG